MITRMSGSSVRRCKNNSARESAVTSIECTTHHDVRSARERLEHLSCEPARGRKRAVCAGQAQERELREEGDFLSQLQFVTHFRRDARLKERNTYYNSQLYSSLTLDSRLTSSVGVGCGQYTGGAGR